MLEKLKLLYIIISIFNCISFLLFFEEIKQQVKEDKREFSDEIVLIVMFFIGVIPIIQLTSLYSNIEMLLLKLLIFLSVAYIFITTPMLFYRWMRRKYKFSK